MLVFILGHTSFNENASSQCKHSQKFLSKAKIPQSQNHGVPEFFVVRYKRTYVLNNVIYDKIINTHILSFRNPTTIDHNVYFRPPSAQGGNVKIIGTSKIYRPQDRSRSPSICNTSGLFKINHKMSLFVRQCQCPFSFLPLLKKVKMAIRKVTLCYPFDVIFAEFIFFMSTYLIFELIYKKVAFYEAIQFFLSNKDTK